MKQQPESYLAFDYCTINGFADVHPEFHRSSFEGLSEYLQKHTRLVSMTREAYLKLSAPEQRHVKNGPAIILARFRKGATRADDNVEYTTGLGLDVDESHIEYDALVGLLAGHAAIVYESANSTQESRRWRVLLPYAMPATPEGHARAFEYWSARIPGVSNASRNVSRLWYGVTQFAKARKRVFEVLAGEPFNPLGLTVPTDPVARSKAAFKRSITVPAETPAAEGARNAALNAYATKVVRDHATYEALLLALLAHNETYAPPLDAREVQSLAKRKWKNRAKFGWVAQPVGNTHEDDDAPVGCDISTVIDHDPGSVPWVVQDVLAYGAHLLVGRPKGGKSWITMDMAFAVANGGTFMGKQARKCRALWIAGEDTKDTLARRLKVRGEQATGVTVMTTEDLRDERARCPAELSFEAWLDAYLGRYPSIDLVIIDTLATVNAKWMNEMIDQKRSASVVDIAYQKSRVYEDIGHAREACIVLVTHTRKRNGKEITDYHELINEAQTIVAGATTSLVLADPPDRDPHDKDDHRRIFAMRSRNLLDEQPLLIELKDARAKVLGPWFDVKQSEAQAVVLECVEAILNEQEKTTIAEVAQALGQSQRNVRDLLARAAKGPGGLVWKGHTLVVRAGRLGGLFWG